VLVPVAGEVAVVAVDHRQLAPMKRDRSKVEMPARSAKVANVWRKSYGRPRGSIPAACDVYYTPYGGIAITFAWAWGRATEQSWGQMIARRWRLTLLLAALGGAVLSPPRSWTR
jgi:hypothetical protein